MGKKSFVCDCCEPNWFSDTKSKLVAHYAKVHPEHVEQLWDAVGETWDPKLSELLKARDTAQLEARGLRDKYKALETQYQTLAQKWNAILLIMGVR